MSFWFFYPSKYKTSFRYLPIAFKYPYLGKTYIRCLQDILTVNNCKRAQKCLRKIFNRHLIKMSTSDVSKTNFRQIF